MGGTDSLASLGCSSGERLAIESFLGIKLQFDHYRLISPCFAKNVWVAGKTGACVGDLYIITWNSFVVLRVFFFA
jgi:hypothetical protein